MPPTSTHLLLRAKVLAEVSPSPVGPAIVKVVWPMPPTPIPAYEGPFLTNIVVWMSLAIFVRLSTFRECIIAV